MRVLLISANQLIEPYPVYPLGLDYVAGALGPAHQVLILDKNQIPGDDELRKTIHNFGPDIVGLSLRNVDTTDGSNPGGFLEAYVSLMDVIRGAVKAPVVLGGSGFTIFPSEAMALLKADFGVLGEGERMSLLLDAIEKNADPSLIPGVITFSDTAKTPPPPWNDGFSRRFDTQSAYLPFYLNHSGMLNLQTKRGCPFRCIYCTYPHIEGHSMRLIPPQEVGQTAAELQAAGAKYLFITDSAFNADVNHSLAVARALQKSGVSIPWGAFFAPMPLPSDYFNIMADCGLTHVEFGTESLSDPVLAAYGKPFRSREVYGAHAQAKQAGLHTAHYFLFGGPGETIDTLNETLGNMQRLEDCVFFLFCGMRIYPNTALYDLALAQGQCQAGQNIFEPVYYQSSEIDSRVMLERIYEVANDRRHWLIGSGGKQTAAIKNRMYRRGFTGPLWEKLCP